MEEREEEEDEEEEEEEERLAAAAALEVESIEKKNREKAAQEKEETLTPRTQYNIKSRCRMDEAGDLVNYLNMSSFRRQFQSQKGKVDLATFICMMQKALSKGSGSSGGRNNNLRNHRQRDTSPALPFEIHSAELVARLIELFREIDLDGDGLIVWDEFTRFIVDKATIFNVRPCTADPRHDVILHYYHQHTIDPLSRYRHKDYLDRLVSIPRRGYVAAIEQRSPVVTFYNSKSGKVINQLRCKAPPMSMVYVGEPERVLVTANADLTMVSWNLDEGPIRSRWSVRNQWPTPSAQVSLCWVPSQQLLYSGSTNGTIYAWDICRRQQRYTLRGHKDIVFDLLSMDNLHTVASASMDTTVGIWDTYLGKLRLCLTGHKKGVFSLAYNQDYRVLVSAGFDHEAYVWSPFVNTLLYKLKGHTASLVGTLAVEGKPEIITADSVGYLKLWDVRNYQCLQTFTTDHETGDLNDLRGLTCLTHSVVDHHQPRIVVATKRIHFFDQLRIKSDPYTDDLPINVAIFNYVDLTIITASGRNIKIWDALTGSLRQAFLNLAKTDITAVCLDHRHRKMIVGDTTGHIDAFNHQTGQHMKDFDKLRDAVVTHLHYLVAARQVIAAYNDGFLCIYSESPIHHCPMLMEFDPSIIRQNDLAAFCVSSATSRVASASSLTGDRIYIWNPDTAKCDSILDVEDDASYSVVSMTFLDPAPLLAVACSDGCIRIWATWSIIKGRRSCILAFSNEQPASYVTESPNEYTYPLTTAPSTSTTSPSPPPAAPNPSLPGLSTDLSATHLSLRRQLALSSVPVLSMAWDSETEALFTGDDCGRIRKWDLCHVLATLEKEKILIRSNSHYNCATATLRVQELGGMEVFLPPSLIKLEWSLEGHEDAVLSLQLIQEPPALLSASSDQCAKMWTVQGRPVGTLIQGLPQGMSSPGWDLPFDVGPRQGREDQEVEEVTELARSRLQRKRKSLTMARQATANKAIAAAADQGEGGYESHDTGKHFDIVNLLGTVHKYQTRKAEDLKQEMINPKAADRRMRSLQRETQALPSLFSQPLLGGIVGKNRGEGKVDHQPSKAMLPALTSTFKAVPGADAFDLGSPRHETVAHGGRPKLDREPTAGRRGSLVPEAIAITNQSKTMFPSPP